MFYEKMSVWEKWKEMSTFLRDGRQVNTHEYLPRIPASLSKHKNQDSQSGFGIES
jgi:hypothetical protein